LVEEREASRWERGVAMEVTEGERRQEGGASWHGRGVRYALWAGASASRQWVVGRVSRAYVVCSV
jgi:hypothetical protein